MNFKMKGITIDLLVSKHHFNYVLVVHKNAWFHKTTDPVLSLIMI